MSPSTEIDESPLGQDGNAAFSSHSNIELTTDEAEMHTDEMEKTSCIVLEKSTNISNGTPQNQVRILEEKLSTALLNMKAKDETVKQHEKVAVEAVAGWEKAQIEVAVLKQKFEASNDEKLAIEQRLNHLNEALKECLTQLTQAREEQEQKIQEAVLKKTREWDLTRSDLESQVFELQAAVETSKADSDLCYKLQYLENENLALKHEFVSQSEELEVRTIERDLNAQAAEVASKQHLDSIRRLAKLEAENRNLRSIIGKSSSTADHKSVSVSSLCVESLTDSQSDCGEQMNAVEMNFIKMGINECEPSCSDSWTSASFAELENFKKQKAVKGNVTNSATEIDLMEDFLEMEHLAALPVTEPPALSYQAIGDPSSPSARLNDLYQRTYELREKLEIIETQKTQLEDLLEKTKEENSILGEKVINVEKLNAMLGKQKTNAELINNDLTDRLAELEEENAKLNVSLMDRVQRIGILEKQVKENENALQSFQIELNEANDTKQYYEQQSICTEVELQTMAAKVDDSQEDVTTERARSKKLEAKCRYLEDALLKQKQEVELELSARLNAKLKVKQEDLALTALKLAECQETIMSLGSQLQSLTTLEDFLYDGKHSQLIVDGSLIPGPGGDMWKMHSNSAFLSKKEAGNSTMQAVEENVHAHAVCCSSSKVIAKYQMDNVNGENGHASIFSDGVEQVSNNAPLDCDV